MSTEEKAVHKKTNLEWQARASLRKRIDDPDWDWDKTERYERHAINAILDLEEAEAVNKELLQALEALPLESFGEDMEAIDAAEFVDHAGEFFEAMILARAAIAKARGI